MDTGLVLAAIGVSSTVVLVSVVLLAFSLRRTSSSPPSQADANGPLLSQLNAVQLELNRLHQIASDQAAAKESLHHLEMVIAGTKSKGTAGENVVDDLLSALPPNWKVTNFKTTGGVVEFGLQFPSTGLVLPIDSKWPASSLLDQLSTATSPVDQAKIKQAIESAVLQQAKVVAKYLDPDRTLGFALAVIPDAAYSVCSSKVHVGAFNEKVVLVSYSLLIPYLLMVFETVSASTQSIDLVKLEMYLKDAGQRLDAIRKELDGRVGTAITMLQNGRNSISTQVSKLHTDLGGLQVGAGLPEEALPLPLEELNANPEVEPALA